MFFNSLCQNFHFEVRVPGCYLVNLCQISSLSMADHVFYSFCCYFWFWGGSTWVYQVNLSQIWSLSMADHVFNSFCCYIWFWGGSTWVVVGKSFSIFKFKHGWSCFLEVFVIIFDFYMGVPWSTWEYFCYSVFLSVEYLGVLGSTWEYLAVPGSTT